MREPIRITIPFDVNRLSPNRRLHWTDRYSATRAALDAARLAWCAAGSPIVEGKARIDLVIRRERQLDPYNALAAANKALDGLLCRRRRGYGVIEDDSARYVTIGTLKQETGAKWKGREELDVIITPLGEE